MQDESVSKKTLSGLEVKIFNSEDCKCNLSSFTIIGEVFFDGKWIRTKWNDKGDNVSGIKDWKLDETENSQ